MSKFFQSSQLNFYDYTNIIKGILLHNDASLKFANSRYKISSSLQGYFVAFQQIYLIWFVW